MEQVEVSYAGHPYLEGLVIAILLGVAIRAFWTPGQVWKPGIAFSAKTLLEIAVVLLGASLSAVTVIALGPILLIGIAIIVAVAIVTSYALCRVRVLMLGPVVLGLSLVAGRMRNASGASERRWPPLRELVPWFIVGFLLFALARSLGLIPQDLLRPLRTVAAVLTTIAMAALGLGVDVRVVAKAGLRVASAVTLSLVVLGLISFALIRLADIN